VVYFLLVLTPLFYSYSCYMRSSCYPPWPDYSNYTWRRLQDMKLTRYAGNTDNPLNTWPPNRISAMSPSYRKSWDVSPLQFLSPLRTTPLCNTLSTLFHWSYERWGSPSSNSSRHCFLNMTPCNMMEKCRNFGETRCPHLLPWSGRRPIPTRCSYMSYFPTQATRFSKTSVCAC
jgi:hypothetical protein